MERRHQGHLNDDERKGLAHLGRSAVLSLIGTALLATIFGIVDGENIVLFLASCAALFGVIISGWMYISGAPWLQLVRTLLLPLAALCGAQIGSMIAALY